MKHSKNPLKIATLIAIIGLFMLVEARGDMAPRVPSTSDWTAPAEAKKLKNPVPANAESQQKGKALYQKSCLMCHGEKGAGDGPMAVHLNPKPAFISKETIGNETDGELFWKITNGKLPMPGFKSSLPETDRWHVVNYIRTF